MSSDIVEIDGKPVTPELLAAAQELSAQDGGYESWEKHCDGVKRDYLRCARDVVEQYLAAIQETRAIVPREPTEAMCEIGADIGPIGCCLMVPAHAHEVYTAMIAASDAP